ncbi:AGAP008095-PA [Rhizoctonia solani]|uniref:AGAP008095-PA n=1 Tax=Rhizoctonia solani TaxID=456999 RepID=A0A0K6FWS3_9AGAM|nr:AGAP008095-PA [Rhizoctonia solani]
MSRPQDSSHRTFSSSNYVSRSTAHRAEGRLRINFSDPTFLEWRKLWGQSVFFCGFEYRKLRAFPEHEFILLKYFSSIPGTKPSTDIYSEPGQSSGPKDGVGKSLRRLPGVLSGVAIRSSTRSSDPSDTPTWVLQIPENINKREYVLKLERQANPETQFNATHRTEAYDFAEFKLFEQLDEKERNSTVELAITFPQAIPLEEVFKICSSISQHPYAQQYTLRQYNCYFFAWCITTMLVRLQMHYDWVRILRSEKTVTMQLINKRLAELSNPQRLRGQCSESNAGTEVLPNLALFLTGEYSLETTLDSSQRPFIQMFSSKLIELSTFERIASSLIDKPDQPLWARDQHKITREIVGTLLESVADSTIRLATAGTGKSDAVALFWGNTSIPLSDSWDARVKMEYRRLLAVYVDRIWAAFREALEQTSQAERRPNPSQATQTRPTQANIISLIQRIGNSPTMLTPQLTQLGLRAAWNAAGVAAEAQLSDPQRQPFLRAMRRLQHTPGQISHVAHIRGPFLDVLSNRREQIRANRGQRQTDEDSLSLDTLNVLGMMGNINLQPQEEDQIVIELERSVKNMAMGIQQPNLSVQELREATLELMLRLKETARKINFGLDPSRAWRVCVWYSLSEEVIRVISQASQSSTWSIQCWSRAAGDNPRATSGQKRPTPASDIHEFVHGRIERLSEMIHNQRGPGTTRECRVEIEEAMTKIWQGVITQGEIVTR